MKKFFLGILLGLSLGGSVVIIHTYTNCFSCGFLGIDYCGYGGMLCESGNLYIRAVSLLSLPVIVAGLAILNVIPSVSEITLPQFIFLNPLFLLYWGMVVYLVSKIRSKYRAKKSNTSTSIK